MPKGFTIPKKYCYCCGSLLKTNSKWYYVYDKVYCSYYEALNAEKYLYTTNKYKYS